ncbi:MAG: excalibur calcium-binding domain-containing protein [Erysipelotrichaceae bacterium]|nr:excalibur calcium-binding domain-containing protein [Erysipelotrichaceae bacterium]
MSLFKNLKNVLKQKAKKNIVALAIISVLGVNNMITKNQMEVSKTTNNELNYINEQLKNENKDFQLKIANLENENSKLVERLNEADESVVNNLKIENEELRKEILKVTNEKTKLETDNKNMKTTISSLNDKISNLNSKLVLSSEPKYTEASSSSTKSYNEPSNNGESVYYKNCKAAKAAGAAPLYQGQPGYRSALDRDGDEVACE